MQRFITSKLTKQYQATIPEPVRCRFNLKIGDAIAFDINDNTIQLRKAPAIDLLFAQNLETTLVEWHSAADEQAYREL